jgi:hypothetical protein
MPDRTQKKIIGAPCLVSFAYWRRGTSVRQYIGVPMPPRYYFWRTDGFTSPIGGQNKKNKKKEANQTVLCALPIFKPIAC